MILILAICSSNALYLQPREQQMKTSVVQTNLIAEQRSLLKKIYSQGENLWKVVIFDTFNRDINSGLFKMKDLRENNITLYFSIKDNREQLHGVTAIYLVEPNPENINLILNDFDEDLYSSVVIHFSSQPQNHIISSMAKKLAKNKPAALTKIQKIEYSYLGFYTMARNMAVLPDTNQIINLISILKNKPIFVYGPKEEQKVSFLKERLMMGNVFGKEQELIALKQTHNIVFFFNREADYFPVLHHGISYAGLLQSIFKFTSNGRKIQRQKEQPIDIDLNDDIWTQRRNLSTSQLSLDQQLSAIRAKKMSEKQRLNELSDSSERQKKIELHTQIVLSLIKQASSRKLNQFNECQIQIHRKRVLTNQLKKDILVLLQTTDNDSDKIRLILIVLLYCEHISVKEIEEFQEKVPKLEKNKMYQEIKNKIVKETAEGQNSGMVGGAGKMFKKFSIGLMSNFKSGDKFLVTKYVEKISSFKENELKEMGLIMSGLENIPVDVKIGNIIVYCMGGGCLAEEANLSKFDPRVIYTCDRMMGAGELTS